MRDEVRHTLITIKPEEIVSIDPHLRQAVNQYVQTFELRWLLDDEDLAPDTRARAQLLEGTHSHFREQQKQQQEDGQFNASKALDQSDAAEIASIWKEHDTLTYVPHSAIRTPGTDSADFLTLQEKAAQHEGPAPYQSDDDLFYCEGNPLTGDEPSTLPEDGPAYLRNSPAPTEVDDFGQDDPLSIMDVGSETGSSLPDSAPVTLSQLQLYTKAQLWETADKLGIDNTGTKKDLIDRVCKYWWRVHHTNLQVLNKS